MIFGVGLAALVAPITTTAIASAPEHLAGVASGVNMMVARVGGLLAVALMGFVITRVFEGAVDAESAVPLARGEEDPELRAASVDAWQAAVVDRRAALLRGGRCGARHLELAGRGATRRAKLPVAAGA